MYDSAGTDIENICNSIDLLSTKINTMNKYLHDINESILNLSQSVEYIKNGNLPNGWLDTENHINEEKWNDCQPGGAVKQTENEKGSD